MKPKYAIELVVKDPLRTILGTVQLVLDERALEIVGGEAGAVRLRQLFEVAWVGGIGLPLVLHSRCFPAKSKNPLMDVSAPLFVQVKKKKARKKR